MKLSESQIHNIVRKSIYKVLNEDKRGEDAKKRCLAVIRQHFNNADWLDTPFNHTDNPEGLSHIDYMYKQFINEFYHDPNYRSKPVMRLAPLFCKLAFEANFQNNNPDTQKLNRLAAILRLIYNMDEQGKNVSGKIDINNTTFDDLNNQFGTIIDNLNKQENERIQNTQYERNSNYEVIGPVNYETAKKYGDYSCSESKLCYTQSKKTWNNYTQDGCNNVYIILQKGWENILEKHDDESNSAYDTYGLSMIFVFVDGQGDLACCNTRWNHEANYKTGFSCDHAMSKEMISQLIGVRFDEVFKPNNKWKELLINIQKRLKKGENPEYIFDTVWGFYNGFAEVELGDKHNLINEQGELVWKGDIWFDYIGDFYEGLAKVRMVRKGYNFINEQGKLLWKGDKWFDGVGIFSNGFGKVYIKDRGWNFINHQGELLWKGKEWFVDVSGFDNGYAEVEYNGIFYKLNTKGELCDEYGHRVINEHLIHRVVKSVLREYIR